MKLENFERAQEIRWAIADRRKYLAQIEDEIAKLQRKLKEHESNGMDGRVMVVLEGTNYLARLKDLISCEEEERAEVLSEIAELEKEFSEI